MREIKFRALTEWGWIFWTPGNGDNGFWESNGVFENKTLGEFSGLTDKHGVEIFEGDILKCHDGENRVVKYHYLGFALEYPKGWFDFGETEEVIGNIHEHGDLLNGKKG